MTTKMKKKLLVLCMSVMSLGVMAQENSRYGHLQGNCSTGQAEIHDEKMGEISCANAGCIAKVHGYAFGHISSNVYLQVGGEIITNPLKTTYLHKMNGSVKKIEKDLIKLMDEGVCREAWIINETLEPSSGNKYFRVKREN